MFGMHKHNWEIKSETITESTFEMALRACNNHGDIPHQLCQDNRKHIVILKCGCGQVKRLVTDL